MWLANELEQNSTVINVELKSSFRKDYEANATWGTGVSTRGYWTALTHHALQLGCRQRLPVSVFGSGSVSVHGLNMVISALELKGHLKMSVYILCVTNLLHCRSDWGASASGRGYKSFSFVEQLPGYAVGSATFTLCELPWRGQGSGKILEEQKGGARRSLPTAKVCSQTAAAVLQSLPCFLPGKQCPVSPGQNSAATDL